MRHCCNQGPDEEAGTNEGGEYGGHFYYFGRSAQNWEKDEDGER